MLASAIAILSSLAPTMQALEPGISRELARSRQQAITDIQYFIEFTLEPGRDRVDPDSVDPASSGTVYAGHNCRHQ